MNWEKSVTGDDGVKIPRKWLHLHYYEALTALFRVENALRMFVYIILKDSHKGQWSDLTISSDDGGDTTIAAIAKRRLAQDRRFGYLGYRITSPLMHLTTGELIRLMFAEPYWRLFADYFPGSKEIVRAKLEEIGNIRNAVAHFRPITTDDVEVVKQNANQVLARVEIALTNVLRTYSIVPTNTSDDWYASLKQVAGQYCSLSFRQSENEKWIQLRLTYACPSAGDSQLSDYYRTWPVLTIEVPQMLRRATAIRENAIYASESVPYVDARLDDPPIRKTAELVFSRQTIAETHELIRKDLVDVISSVTTETDLIREDNLARGELIRATKVTAGKQGSYWSENMEGLRSRASDDDPAEYWGTKPETEADFVTDTTSYPWMPVDISDTDEVPF